MSFEKRLYRLEKQMKPSKQELRQKRLAAAFRKMYVDPDEAMKELSEITGL